MAVGVDIGTMFLVKAQMDEVVGGASFISERNAFLQANTNVDTEDTLKENNWSYARHGDNFYILGEDAIRLKTLLGFSPSEQNKNITVAQVGELRRPMKDGILNTSQEKQLSIAIIQKLIANLIGPPSCPKENLCFCAPGDPVDRNLSVVVHKSLLTSFLVSLGYDVECIPEALAIIFSERPVAADEKDPSGEAPHSGIAMSFGAGMCNICLAWRKMPLISFSIARSGDWIDREAAAVAGVDVAVMTRFKETKFDLSKVDHSDMKQSILDIFYQEMITHALTNFADKFNQLKREDIDVPLEIVVAGGTASVPGFLTKFNEVLSVQTLPFKVKGVRLATNPLYAVANGCLLKAINSEGKKQGETDEKAPEKKKK